jgi:4a-hydroxytetrahydrobiopterin dehydratase
MAQTDAIDTGLAEKECVPCKGGTPALKGAKLKELSNQLSQGWTVVNEHHLEKKFKLDDFRQALDFTNEVGELAESVNHHPDIYLAWGEVKLTLWTHKIDGLTESDFIFAAKVDKLRK